MSGSSGGRPCCATIYRHFGSWPKAIEAARAAIESDGCQRLRILKGGSL